MMKKRLVMVLALMLACVMMFSGCSLLQNEVDSLTEDSLLDEETSEEEEESEESEDSEEEDTDEESEEDTDTDEETDEDEDVDVEAVPVSELITMSDYSAIEIASSDVEVTDDEVEEMMEAFTEAYTTEEEVTEGTVAEGDVIVISYVGTLDGEEFDGGSADDVEITVGESGYIDGFDDGLIGVEIGDTVDLDLTFPDDYSEESLAGEDVVFTVTVSYRIETTVPEMTDDFVAEYSDGYCGEQVDTVDDMYAWFEDYCYTYYLQTAMISALMDLAEIVTYDDARYELLYAYAEDEIEYYADYYGLSEDTFAYYYGYDDADEYVEAEAVYYYTLWLMFEELWDELGLGEVTDEMIDEGLTEYMALYGYDDYYTLDEFKEGSGETWLLLYKGYVYRMDPVIDELVENYVTFVDSDEE